MLKKLKQQIVEMSEPNISNSTVPMFRQLVSYIDNGLAESYQKEGDERAAQLVTHMLNLRDFMTRQVTDNGLRQILMKEILTLIDQIEQEENASEEAEPLEQMEVAEGSKKNAPDTFLTETK